MGHAEIVYNIVDWIHGTGASDGL